VRRAYSASSCILWSRVFSAAPRKRDVTVSATLGLFPNLRRVASSRNRGPRNPNVLCTRFPKPVPNSQTRGMAKRARTAAPCAEDLVSELVKIGSHPSQKQQMGKPFPLVLSPAKERVSFVELQEYFLKRHAAIIKAASEVSCDARVVP
jgi:hypothetical protein